MGIFDIFRKRKAPKLSSEDLKMNKLWDMWCENKVESPFSDLMEYQSQVNNGGHGQYFYNVDNSGDLEAAMSALTTILPREHKDNMERSYRAHLLYEENADKEDAENILQECEDILEECDDFFYENEKSIIDIVKERALKIEL